MCHIANLQLIVAGAIFIWLIEGAGAKISIILVLVYEFDAMVSIFLALTFGRALLFHYCTHEGRSQHSVADTGALLNFGDKLSLEDLPTQCKHAKCKGPFFFKGTLFLLRAVRTAYGKMRPKYGNIRPIWTRPNQQDLKKSTFFFTSVRPSVKTISAAGTTRSGRVDVLKTRVYSA